MSVNCNSLPSEIVVRIFKLLNLTEICRAQLVCKRWKEIIENFNLVKEATGNINQYCYFLNHMILWTVIQVKHEYLRSRASTCLSLSSSNGYSTLNTIEILVLIS